MKKGIIFGVIALLVAILALSSCYTVQENQYACTFRFSEIVNTESESGLHFKIPFIDTGMEGNRMGEDNSCFKTVWTFKNVSSDSLKSDWLLYYNQFSRRAVYEENTPVKLEQVIADFYRIYPTEDYKTLAPGDSMVVNIYMRGSALKITEAPMGMYFVPCDKDGKELTPMAMAPVKKSLNIFQKSGVLFLPFGNLRGYK